MKPLLRPVLTLITGVIYPLAVTGIAQMLLSARAVDPGNSAPVTVDLVTRSTSGLDPHISPAAAFYQAPRVNVL